MHRFQVLVRIAMAYLLGVIPLGCVQNAEKPAAQADLKTAVQGNADKRKTNEKDQDLQADVKTLVQGNNEFAFDLYRQLAQKPGNIVFSPYSISTALGMTYAGARGDTAKEMAQALHFTLDQERLHPAFGDLVRKVNGSDMKRNYQLAVANSLWGAKGLSLEPQFLRIMQSDYQAGFQFADFVGDAEGSRRRINGWIEDKTNKKVEDLIPKGIIDAGTRLALVNAVYFKADWAMPFPKKRTWPEDFTVPGSPPFKVPTMHHILKVNYMENTDFQLAEFDYKDQEVSMMVILPKKNERLVEIEKMISAKVFAEAFSSARPKLLQVSLPKFKLISEFSLSDNLVALGMKDAFRPTANFSGINPSESLRISTVFHKAFEEVDEKGAEAAAGTAVNMAASSVTLFRADRPCLFVLRHNATGSILFLGRVFDPRSK